MDALQTLIPLPIPLVRRLAAARGESLCDRAQTMRLELWESFWPVFSHVAWSEALAYLRAGKSLPPSVELQARDLCGANDLPYPDDAGAEWLAVQKTGEEWLCFSRSLPRGKRRRVATGPHLAEPGYVFLSVAQLVELGL